ncbi:MAG: hypothetical protein ACKOW9_02160 [Candidatus Paceibacterota bacterium]
MEEQVTQITVAKGYPALYKNTILTFQESFKRNNHPLVKILVTQSSNSVQLEIRIGDILYLNEEQWFLASLRPDKEYPTSIILREYKPPQEDPLF